MKIFAYIILFLSLSSSVYGLECFGCPGEAGAQEGSDVSFKNMSVTGNLNVSGPGPHNISAVLDNATGNEVGVSIEVTANKATSGDATGVEIDCIDIATPGLYRCLDIKYGGVSLVSSNDDGSVIFNTAATTGTRINDSGNPNFTAYYVSGSRVAFSWAQAANTQYIFGAENTQGFRFQGPNTTVSGVESFQLIQAFFGNSGTQSYLSPTANLNQTGAAEFINNDSRINIITKGTGGVYHYVGDTDGTRIFTVDDEGSMNVGGGVTFSGQTTIFGNYSSKFTENTIFANTSTAAITVTLPDASLNPEGFFQTISKVGANDDFNSVTLQAYTSTQTINRNATRLIEFPGNTVTVKTVGGNWRVVQATPNTLSFTPSSLSTGSTTGDFWTGGGYYHFNATDANLTQASTTVTHGSANEFSGAHAGIVAGGPGSTDAGIVGIRAKGTSIADDGTRTPDDLEVIVADVTTMALNDYFESSKKWNGVVTFELFSSGGATTYSADFNYGHSAYEDFEDNDILLRVFEMDGRAGGNDTAFRVRVYHHEGDGAAGWTYAASGFDPGNGTILDSDDIAPENDLVSGEEFKWDRHNLNTLVQGTQGQGMLIRVTTGAANAVRYGNFRYGHIILSK